MSNDDGLVDELGRLEGQRKEIVAREIELKKKIVELAGQKGVGVLFGNNKKCFVKEYEKIIYPEDKSSIVALLKKKGLWDEFAMLNYSRFGSRVMKKELDEDLIGLIGREKAFRVTLRDVKDGL